MLGHMVLWGSSSPQVLSLCCTQVALGLRPDSSLQLQTLGLNIQQCEASHSLITTFNTGVSCRE